MKKYIMKKYDDIFINFVGGCLVMMAIMILWASCFGLAVMWLWNYTMPYLFSLPDITYGQSFALIVLFWLLFGRVNVNNNH